MNKVDSLSDLFADYVKERDIFSIMGEIQSTMKLLGANQIPNSYSKEFLTMDSNLFDIRRDMLIAAQGFALLTEEFIKPLVRYLRGAKCLEIMSGCGALSYLLKERGIDIKATDNFTSHKSKWDRYWTPIEHIDCVEAIKKYGKDIDIIICSWPDMDDNAYKSLLTMREVNPKCKMIYIGESCYGCTADDNFFDIMYEINHVEEDLWRAQKEFQSWDGIHDRVYLIK